MWTLCWDKSWYAISLFPMVQKWQPQTIGWMFQNTRMCILSQPLDDPLQAACVDRSAKLWRAVQTVCVCMKRRGALTKVSMVTQRSVTHAAANVSHFPKVSMYLSLSVYWFPLPSLYLIHFRLMPPFLHLSLLFILWNCKKGHIMLAAHFTQHCLHAFVNWIIDRVSLHGNVH